MKRGIVVLMFLITVFSMLSSAYSQVDLGWGKDYWGHATKVQNYWKDRDNDGVSNYYDRRDDNKYVQ